MKFDYCIGNPPYQESRDTNNRQDPIYSFFYDAAEQISSHYMLISPARFLYNAGLTPKEWNNKMLNDEHLKIEHFEAKSSDVFPGTDIKGGIVIVYRSEDDVFGAIEHFIPDPIMRSIAQKFTKDESVNLPSIMYGGRSDLKFNDVYLNDYPDTPGIRLDSIREKHPSVEKLGANEEYELKSSTLDVLSDYGIHVDGNTDKDYKIIGLCNGKRAIRYINQKYMSPRYPDHNNICKYKVFVPKANGSGAIGEVLSTPLIGTPLMSATPTFISIGNFDTEYEAESLLKYIKTRFARVLLGLLKKTQDNPPSVWAYIPIQNFTANSDIDWSQSISDIDKQLYKKYNLSKEEIDFIETHVKEMT